MTQILTTTDPSIKEKNPKVYKLHFYIHDNEDPNSPIIFDGYMKEAEDLFKCSEHQLRHALVSDNHLLLQTYYVESTKEPFTPPRKQRKKTDMAVKFRTRFEKKLDMIKRHLDAYGNTFTNKDPKKYTAALKERFGYEIDVEYRPKRVIHMLGSHTVVDIFDPIYILTLVSKPEENNNEQ